MSQPVYFGGSRCNAPVSLVKQVVSSVPALHVGCQLGVDAAVISAAALYGKPAHIFAVESPACVPVHVSNAAAQPHFCVTYQAGGTNAPIKARYLLRSVAAFQGCTAAVFFWPGDGSLAVAREALKAGIPVFAFSMQAQEQPAPVPASTGQWKPSFFNSFVCWQWQPAQVSLF